MTFEHLLVEQRDGIALLTVNRPQVLNALTAATVAELGQAVEALDSDPDVRVVLLTGAGDRAFIAGADISELAQMTPTGAREVARAGQRLCERIESAATPVIAVVNGYALGGGCEIAMACAFRLAGASAQFGQPEITLGLIPGYGGTQRLPRLIGPGRAIELMLTGESVDADEAYRVGLVNRVLPDAELMTGAREPGRGAGGEAADRRRVHPRGGAVGDADVADRGLRSRGRAVRSGGGDRRHAGRHPGLRREAPSGVHRTVKSTSHPDGQTSTDAAGLRVAVVVSAYHGEVTDALRRGAVEALLEAGSDESQLRVVSVPGAFEIPFAARVVAESGQFDAVVCLGCVIRGETPHFDYIASAVAHGITTASQATRVPMSFGVLTTNSYAEALARSGEGADNKGREAARAALELATVVRSFGTSAR